ncbi:hypothetical protein SLE2022_153750 [Rubroshorea leprosula]
MHQEWQSKSKPETGVEESDGGNEDEMNEDSRIVELKHSICNGDWNAVKQYFVFDKHPLDTIIESCTGSTALHVAIYAGQDKIAEELVKIMSETDLEIKTVSRDHSVTVLNAVALTGRTHVAKCIVQKNNKLLTIEYGQGGIPVCGASSMGHKEMTYYLYSVTPPEVLLPRNGNHGFVLIRWGIANNMLDICLDLLQRIPKLAVTTNPKTQGPSPIFSLSRQSSAFFSGSRLCFWQRWIYHWLRIKLPMTSSGEVRILVSHKQDLKEKNIGIQVLGRLRRLGLLLLNFFGIKQIYDLKLRHLYTLEILRCMCNHVSTFKVQHFGKCGVIDAMFEGTKQGMVEFVIELLKVTQPNLYPNADGRSVFTVAIQYRQENIFNLLYGLNVSWTAKILNRIDKKGNSVLHVVGEIAPDFQLARISNSALQMQRELQWFKEVERIVPDWCKESKNFNGETPYEVFSKSHTDLVKEGAKWMKDIASSFIIVGTLIVTILFAAAFTLPGDRWWAIIPIIMMASIPVVVFVWLQFPLVEIFVSTYAPRIFKRKMKPLL